MRCLLEQDGYAVRFPDGAGTYEVEFEAVAGKAQERLSAGKIAYIGTGEISFQYQPNAGIANLLVTVYAA